jgi:fatty acid-binding protein DegV
VERVRTSGRAFERAREIFGTEPAFTSEIGPVIGTYTGPGLIGVAGVPREHLPPPPAPGSTPG